MFSQTSRFIEEHKLNCGLPISIASPGRFRCERSHCDCDTLSLPLCSCLCMSSVSPFTVSSSLGKAIFSLLRGFLLSSFSSLVALNFNSAFLLQKSFVGKSSPSRISSHLLNPELLCLLFRIIARDSPIAKLLSQS